MIGTVGFRLLLLLSRVVIKAVRLSSCSFAVVAKNGYHYFFISLQFTGGSDGSAFCRDFESWLSYEPNCRWCCLGGFECSLHHIFDDCFSSIRPAVRIQTEIVFNDNGSYSATSSFDDLPVWWITSHGTFATS